MRRPDSICLARLVDCKKYQLMAFLYQSLLIEIAVEIVFVLSDVFTLKNDLEFA
jgi:hypothetical protein